jgi:fructokinase
MDLVCLGELLVDMFPAELGRKLGEVSAFHPKPGGAPANVAVAAARLGLQSAFIGKVGDDAFGHHLASVLRNEGVSTRGMRFDTHARTTMAFIAMPNENTSEFVFYRNPGADMLLRADELELDLIQHALAFHFGTISLIEEPSRSATLRALSLARDSGALVSLDVNYRPNLWRSPEAARLQVEQVLPEVDLVKVNDIELELLTGSRNLAQGSSKLLARGPSLCVVTLGPDGSYFQVEEGGEHVLGFQVRALDATGCGDAFVAGLLLQMVTAEDWRDQLTLAQMRQQLRYANAVGALTSLTRGVIPALPTRAAVDEFLAHRA